ncbi:Thioredoxin reductase [Micromonospora phaseoli]|uniref:Thioredoxin reductase n=1 Tax=Micromonospora phaseoli TaxID=1144548 RepID=A0A1H7BY25_9ACTN|nr:NAD(P)-binding domain-containing protein [Micromonospora phaseoli]PZV92758.1 thioredoxin reductase [Micromonospora phaseoli]GIJ76586.1 pyridine nucleotide-disulfide oxidoreductase [Micromonospora phaseoli]SEJ82288.1 Thioredoxin reductase [Micromonospora phaseoli]
MDDTYDPDVTERHRYVIIGGGPAGLQLSYYLHQAGCDYLTLERESAPAGFFRHFPRHRRLISLNKVHAVSDDPEIRLRWDWNSLLQEPADLPFPTYSQEYFPHADDMVRYLDDFHRHHELRLRFDTAVERIEATGNGFVVHTATGPIGARCVVVATGWGRPNVPPIRGIEHAVGYEEMDVDPRHYAGQRVLIIGKGNSAFETASAILGHAAMVHLASPRPLRLAWNTKHPGDVRGHHGAVLDSYQFKTLHAVLDCVIDEIRRDDHRYEVHLTYTHADGETAVLPYDSVLRCTGFAMDTSLFTAGCRPELVPSGRMPATRPDWQSTNVDGLYFAGTIAQDRDFKRASSAFIDGFRYNLRTLTALLRERYEGVPLPHRDVARDPGILTSLVLDRVNWSSALWTQFEFLCDALVVDDSTGTVRHYADLPEDYVRARFHDQAHYYTFGLRWGRDDYRDVFAIERHPQPQRAAESAFIHPVIRRYHGQTLVDELHLLEDLLAEWRRADRHIEPLCRYFAQELGRSRHGSGSEPDHNLLQ